MMGRATFMIWLRGLRRFGVGVVLLYVAVALTLGGTRAARPVWYGLAGAWFLFIGAGTAWSARCAPSAPSRCGRWLEVGATNAALALLLAEVVLQGLVAVGSSSLLLGSSLDAYRLIPGHDYGGGLYGNRRGYPGPELPAEKTPGAIRIAAVGDSFAVGPAVPFADNYLTRLASELPGVEVGNFGVAGAGPREYRAILEQDIWKVHPDVVLVSVFVGNDITESLPRPRHLDPRRHALYLLCQRGGRMLRESQRGVMAPGRAVPDRLAQPALSPQTFAEVEARRLAVCRKDGTPALEKKWRQALAALDQIVQACRRRGVTVAMVLIPDEFQVNDAVLAAALDEAGIRRDELDLEGPQRRLRVFFAGRGVPCLDLLPAFRAAPHTYAPHDTHWNVAGNHLAARQIALWLSRLL
jgi:hypothetical protein